MSVGAHSRRPNGWPAGRAYPVEFAVLSGGITTAGTDFVDLAIDSIEFSVEIDVRWWVEVPGRDDHEVAETGRPAPLWVRGGHRGRRWWRLRKRAGRGLLPGVGVPCLVDPEDPGRLWLDWDAAYREHQPAWDREDAVDREVHRQRGSVVENAIGSLTLPGAPEASEADKARVREYVEEERRRDAEVTAQFTHPGVDAAVAERDALLASAEDAKQLRKRGRKDRATIVSRSDTGERLSGLTVYALELRLSDGRTVLHREALPDRWARKLEPGESTKVRVDPDDPNRLALG